MSRVWILRGRREKLCSKGKYVTSCLEKMTVYIVYLIEYSILPSKDMAKGLDLLKRRTRQEKKGMQLCPSKWHSFCTINPIQSIIGSSINYSKS